MALCPENPCLHSTGGSHVGSEIGATRGLQGIVEVSEHTQGKGYRETACAGSPQSELSPEQLG